MEEWVMLSLGKHKNCFVSILIIMYHLPNSDRLESLTAALASGAKIDSSMWIEFTSFAKKLPMRLLTFICITTFLITSCMSPEDKIVANSADIIKSLIDNPDTYKFKDLEYMDESTYGASVKFWENYFKQNYVKGQNAEFEKDIAAVKERLSGKMDKVSVQKYKVKYFETDATGKINEMSRVLYFDENQEQVKGMVYIYGLDAFEFDGLNDFKKYGEIN